MKQKPTSTDVLAVIRAPLEQYPPSINQVAVLSEAGLRVTVVDTHHNDFPLFQFRHPEHISRIHASQHTQNFKEARPPLIHRVLRKQAFHRAVQRAIRTTSPKVIVAYDPNAMAAVGKIWKRNDSPKLIWHFHELFLPDLTKRSYFSKQAVRFASNHCHRPDLVIFPDRDRANVYQQTTGQDVPQMIVMNCPRRLDALPDNRLTPLLASRGIVGDSPIIYFQCCIGPSRCFEAIVSSMQHWPQEAVFVLVGPVSDSYRVSLEQLARQLGVAHRLVFLGAVPYQELNQLTVGATVGISIISDKIESDPSWRYSAGAVNKRFEYMAAGVPQVANRGNGMLQIIDSPRVGKLVSPDDADEIGHSIASLLDDRGKLREMSQRARRAHRETFCYEKQCGPLVEQIVNWSQPNR